MRAGLPLLRLLTGTWLLLWSWFAQADIAVIVHPGSPVEKMTPQQVSDLYLGRSRLLFTDPQATPLTLTVYEHPGDSPLRDTFFRSLNGMNNRLINAYWARLRFSGEVLPPPVLADNRSVIESISRNRNAIGYVDAAAVTAAVKVVLRLKE